MELESLQLEDLSSLKYQYFSCQFPKESYRTILIVAFAGEYRYGSAGNPDARFMTAIINAGLAAWRPSALVINLQQLSYEWGDLIVEPITASQDRYFDRPFPTAIVVSQNNRVGLTSLVQKEMSSDPALWLFDSMEAAVQNVEEQDNIANSRY